VNGNAEATIALVRVDDPRPYGIATVESNGRISKFVEKSPVLKGPAWINAGIYVLDPNIITQIKAGKFVSLEREIFPGIAANKKMLGLKHHGYWYDIGNTFDYIRANMELLKKHEYSQPSKMHKTVKQPSYIGKNCRIDSNARLGPRVILSDSVHIGDNTQLSECIIFEKTRVGAHCHIQGCVIGENVVIGNGTKINHGSIVAGQIKIPENSVVKPGSSILNW
jgi:mannose-1-phosphate guanylyltransferase